MGTPRFSARQLEVGNLIGEGYSTAEAGRLLGCSASTVKTHERLIAAKLESLYPRYKPRSRIVLHFRQYASAPMAEQPP